VKKLLASVACIACVGWAQIPKRLTLAEAEQRALAQHPAIEATNFEALATTERIGQAKAARQPFVSANFTAAGAPDDSRIAAGALNNPVIYSRLATGLSVSQLVFDFGRTSRLIDSTRSAAAAAEERTKATRADVRIAVRRAYYSALRTQRVLEVARATVESRQLVVDQVSELVKAQLKSSLDLSVVQTNLAEAKLMLASAENEQRALHAQLAEAIGQQSIDLFELVEEPHSSVEPLALSELRLKALQSRPELASLRLEVQSAQDLTAAERALRYPALSAVASAGLIPSRSSSLQSDYAAIGLNVSLPFMNGGLYKARQAEAELRARALHQRVRDLENRIVRDVTVAWLDANTASERVELTRQFVEQARQSLELAQSRYDLGLSSIVELSQAQLIQTNAEIQYASARYELQIRRAVLEYQSGQIR
jgi:outer membrane protein